MTPVSDSALDTLHASATEIFTDALAACNIASAFDRRMRFEGSLLRRLIPDGSGPATIDLLQLQSVSLSLPWAKRPAPAQYSARAHETPQGIARHLLFQPTAEKTQLAIPLF